MRASLPMYDHPEVREATDAWWAALARSLARNGVGGVPAALTRGGSRETLWRADDLLLTQTCGYPLRFEFAGVLTACAAPRYAAEGCDGHLYSSALVARDDEGGTLEAFRGRVLGANAPDSQSGCNCLRPLVGPLARDGRFFASVVWTGSHRGSLTALRDRRADLAAIDAVALALTRRNAPHELEGLRVIGWSEPVPALPYAVGAATSVERLRAVRRALDDAVADPAAAGARAALLIDGFVAIGDDAYARVVQMRECTAPAELEG